MNDRLGQRGVGSLEEVRRLDNDNLSIGGLEANRPVQSRVVGPDGMLGYQDPHLPGSQDHCPAEGAFDPGKGWSRHAEAPVFDYALHVEGDEDGPVVDVVELPAEPSGHSRTHTRFGSFIDNVRIHQGYQCSAPQARV
jgi:hypothetical protein